MFNQSLEHVMVMLPRTRTVALRCIKYMCSCKWTLPWTLLFHPTPPQDWWSKCDVWACLSHIGVRMCAQLDPCAQFSWIRADVSGSLQAQTHSKMTNICGFMALSAEKVTPRDYQYLSLDEDWAQVAGISGRWQSLDLDVLWLQTRGFQCGDTVGW
jgi:hypothetical protein